MYMIVHTAIFSSIDGTTYNSNLK